MKTKISLLFSLLAFGFLTDSCSYLNWGDEPVPEHYVQKYNNHYLLKEDIAKMLPENLSQQDSLLYVEDLVRKWLENQIIIEKANKELPESNSDISAELEQYKADLLYYKYEDFFVKNQLKTYVTLEELEQYYDEHKADFTSQIDIVKVVCVEIPKTYKDRYKAKSWLKQNTEKSIEKAQMYCYKKADASLFDFDGKWIPFSRLEVLTDSKKLKREGFYKGNVLTAQRDDKIFYILLSDIVKPGSAMPLDYAKELVTGKIVNERKQQLKEKLDVKINHLVDDYLSKKQ